MKSGNKAWGLGKMEKGFIGGDWMDIIQSRTVVLWGTGQKAKRLMLYFQAMKADAYPYNIKYAIDNNRDKENFYGLPVKHPDDIKDWKKLFIIVAVQQAYHEIKEQLCSLGLIEIRDFVHWQEIDWQETDKTTVLGISALYHDAAAVLIKNGEIIAAAQEERFTRVKHDPRFPENAIRYCMKEARIRYEDLDAVVYYDNPFLSAERLLCNIAAIGDKDINLAERNLRMLLSDKLWIHKKIELCSGKRISPENIFVTEHHISHAASAFFASPFEEAAILTFDGVGEWATSTIGIGKGNKLKILKEMDYPHSLGLLYSAFTYFCGFKVNSGEYKLMGLAPYGEPVYYDAIKSHLIKIYEDGSYKLNLKYFDFYLGGNMTNVKFAELFGGEARRPEEEITRREMDLAASIQQVIEEVVIKAARYAKEITGLANLCLAGGIALNCVANGKLLRERVFDHIWIQPAAGDAGGALGAAYYIYYHQWDRLRIPEDKDSMKGSYLGPSYDRKQITAFLSSNGYKYYDYYEEPDAIYQKIAEYLSEDKIIGLFQGRMEYGPRALGNRSIIANPMSKEMQSKLNLKIKFRESFRPFAPSVLTEKSRKYFKLDCESPYMLLVAEIKDELRVTMNETESNNCAEMNLIDMVKQCRSQIPAVTHIDYSARVQTVSEDTNYDYYKTIKAFEEKTGCACIVNTSFNVRGEPIVCSPQDAYRCFMRTDMDILVMGKCILVKEEQNAIIKEGDWRKEYELD